MHPDRHHSGQSTAGGHHHHEHTHGGATAEVAAEAPARGSSEHQGHDKHAGHSVAMFRDKFWISLAAHDPDARSGGTCCPGPWATRHRRPRGALDSGGLRHGGVPVWRAAFIQGAVRELRDRLPGMMTLIALAITVAFVFSAAVTLGYPGMPLWEELATLVTIMLLGHWIEMRSISQAQGALASWPSCCPNTAARVSRGAERSRRCRSRLRGAISCSSVPVRASLLTAWCGWRQRGERGDGHGRSRDRCRKKPGDRVIAGQSTGRDRSGSR